MEAGFVASIIAICLASVLFFVIGIVVGRHTKKAGEQLGVLNVDCSDPANVPYLYLELTTTIADISDRKQVMFDVRIVK